MSEEQPVTPPCPLHTAVLFLIYKRPDTTKQVFEAIRQAKPPRLYVAADGPKAGVPGESEKVRQTRDIVLNGVDWDCEVKTLFRDTNLGCKYGVSEGIDWFFENEKEGIILEDDTLPSQSFFWFCQELLERYRDDERVGQIGGANFQFGIKRGEADYYFSIYNHIWGWASWADRWGKYDVTLNTIENSHFIDNFSENKKFRKYWKNIFSQMKQKKIDTWDYQWTLTMWNSKQLTILPNINLVKNIGFGGGATHTSVENKFSNLKHNELFLKKHPECIQKNFEADEFTFKIMFEHKNIFVRIFNKIKNIL
jgi:hypothetical protein